MLPLSNLSVLILYLFNFDLLYKSKLTYILILLTIFCLISLFSINSSKAVFKHFMNYQVSLFVLICCFLLLDFLFIFFPNLFPAIIRSYLTKENIDSVREVMVDYLDTSPYVKFKPNTLIRSQGYRGTSNQFSYEWITDHLGFKNLDSVSKLKKVDIVALGNSFTEGMGVSTEYIWPSILTKKGYPTYNLGVQGYAPIQIEGTLKKYGLRFSPKYVIIGYCASTYGREKSFINTKLVIKNKKFTGGIDSIANHEIKRQTKFISSALYQIATISLKKYFFSTKLKFSIVDPIFIPYQEGILSIKKENLISDISSNSLAWQNTLKAFNNIIKMARSINAKIIIVYFPHRPEVYFKRATGKDMPEKYFEKIESNLIHLFTQEKDIGFINPFKKLQYYVNNLEENFDIEQLPYLQLDGHMSKIGHLLIAEEILLYIQTKSGTFMDTF